MLDNTKNILGKIPPNSIEIEQALLGRTMMSISAILVIEQSLTIESFYKPEHQKIYEGILSLRAKDVDVDTLTLLEVLRKQGTIEECGGFGYISKLMSLACFESQVETYILILKEKEIGRRQIELGAKVLEIAYNVEIDPLEANNQINDEVFKVNNLTNLNTDKTNAEILFEVKEEIKLAGTVAGMTGIDTGYKHLNDVTGGWQKTELIILAARPAMGKTALALCFLLNAIKKGKKVLFFSLEMGSNQLMKRLVSIESSVSSEKLKSGNLHKGEWEEVNSSFERLNNSNLKIIDNTYTLSGIIAKAKLERLKNGVDFIVVDYLQLIENAKKSGNREQEISEISRRLKMLAKDLNVPVIALSQLSRAVETRGGDKRPMLSDLRESGAIEQDADMVAFLYRAQYYGFTEDSNGESTEGKAELLIAKNRSGSLADVDLKFIHYLTKFEDPNKSYGDAMLQNMDF